MEPALLKDWKGNRRIIRSGSWLPAIVKTSVSIKAPVPLEALVSPQLEPLDLLMTAQRGRSPIEKPLSLLMPSERGSLPRLMVIQMIVAIKSLRFGFRSASDAGEGHESYGQSGGSQEL